MNQQILVYNINNDGHIDIFTTQAHESLAHWLESTGSKSSKFQIYNVIN